MWQLWGNMHIVLHASAVLDGCVWYCGNGGCLNCCRASKSVCHNSYFTGSHLQIPTILLMTWDIPGFYIWIHSPRSRCVSAIADYGRYAIDVLVDYVEIHSERVKGPGKIVEIDKSKIGKRKFKRGHFVEGQWVFWQGWTSVGFLTAETGFCPASGRNWL